jgi:glycosyltransferase involved in cell wall biosynthesis
MRILQITKKFPFPLKDGESIAVNNLAEGLQEIGWTIDLLSMNTSKHPFEEEQIPSELGHYTKVFYADIDNTVTWYGALSHLIRGKSYQAGRFEDQHFKRKLIEVLSNNAYDIVQLESFYLAPYIKTIRKYSSAHISMRAHNVEHVIWKRLAKHSRWGLKKWYYNRIANELEILETGYLAHYDSLIAISEYDKSSFHNLGYKGKSLSLPIGLDLNAYHRSPAVSDSKSIGFIGSLDWKPNIQGLDWFLDHVWPKVLQDQKGVLLHIAGKGASKNLERQIHSFRACKFVGEVPSSNDFLSKHSIMIVPLLSGSGIRVKIIEGMAKGMLVITTSCGLEGIPATHKENVLVSQNASEMAKNILFALNHPVEAKIMQQEAFDFVKTHYDKKVIAQKLHQFYLNNALPKLRSPNSTFKVQS